MWLGLAFSVKVTGMMIDLPADQQKWLEAEVAAGRFASVEEALSIAVLDLRLSVEADDSWMKPYVEEAWRAVDAGDVISGEEFLAELDETITSLRSR
jgi:antitoxin ParD1/3/4